MNKPEELKPFEETKPVITSVAVISNFLTAIMPIMVLLGYDLSPEDIAAVEASEEAAGAAVDAAKAGVEMAKEGIDGAKVAIGALAATLAALWGRWRASKKLRLW